MSKTTLESLKNDTISLIDFRNWSLPDEIRNFISTNKRSSEPIRDIIICYLMIFSAWLASFTNHIWWVYLLSCLTVTSALVGFIALAHESFHDNIASKRVNDFLARVFIAPPLLMDYDYEREIHLNHHKYLGTNNDPTLKAYSCSKKKLWNELTSRFFLLGSLTWIIKKRLNPDFWKPENASPKRWFWNFIIMLEQISIFILFMFVNPPLYLLNWALPLILTSILSSIREFGEHKSFDNSKPICIANTHTNILERLLVSQFNFTRHAAHHLFPSVPYNHLHGLTDLLNKHGWPETNIPILIRNSYIKNLL